jgi:hypothetical protein
VFQSLDIPKGKLGIAIVCGGYLIYCVTNPNLFHAIDSLDLIIHEAGHPIMSIFGQFIYILGGSLFQVLIPFIFVIYFLRQKDYFASSLFMAWLGYNMVNISTYMNDSIDMKLPLLGGDSSIHDWNYLLSSLNILEYTHSLASLVSSLGLTIMTVTILGMFYFVVKKT